MRARQVEARESYIGSLCADRTVGSVTHGKPFSMSSADVTSWSCWSRRRLGRSAAAEVKFLVFPYRLIPNGSLAAFVTWAQVCRSLTNMALGLSISVLEGPAIRNAHLAYLPDSSSNRLSDHSSSPLLQRLKR